MNLRDHLNAGGLVVYPTSTLPGLGCLPIAEGLDNLYRTKNRPDTMPTSIGVASLEQAKEWAEIPGVVTEMLNDFPRGGITVILPALQTLDKRLGGDSIAIRVFAHPAAIALAAEYGPITATSANPSGDEPECDTEIAAKVLGVEHYVPGLCPNGPGSTFVKLEKDTNSSVGWSLRIMREGVVPRNDVVEWWTNLT